VIERPTRPLRPTRSSRPNQIYLISTRTRTSGTISPSPPRKAARGERKRGSEGGWGKLSRDLGRRAKGAGCKGGGHAPQGAGKHGGAAVCPPFVLAHGVRQRGARTHALFPAGPQLRYRYRYAAATKTGGVLRARRRAAARDGNAQPRPFWLVPASPQSSTGRRR
jgi:hypothetical protein